MFIEVEGWFVSVISHTNLLRREVAVVVKSKPMALDPIFWRIVDLPKNNGLPLSFRDHGAWICYTPAVNELALNDDDRTPKAVAQDVIAWANLQLSLQRTRGSLTSFLDQVRLANNPWYLPTEITTLILANRLMEARNICSDARAGGEAGVFNVRGVGNFIEMASKLVDELLAIPSAVDTAAN